MAGIGFKLRSLARQDSISSIVAAAGHAAMIAAGPWLFTIATLAGITIATDRVAGLEVLATFRAIVIYAFAISLVFSSPVTIVATRLVGDALWLKQPRRVLGLMLGGLWVVQVPTLIGVAIVVWVFKLPTPDALALAAMTAIASAIWIAISFCGAVRDYRGVTLSFLSGLLVAFGACIATAIYGGSHLAMACAFAGGLTVVLFGLIGRVISTFPHPVATPGVISRAYRDGFKTYWSICFGAFLGTAAVWVDKVVFWFSEVGEAVANGLKHAPIYDSTMFIASLALIPALSSFVVNLETGFFDRYQRYYATIATHGTLDQIEAARQRLSRYTLDSLALITITLAGIAAILLLTAPIIVDAVGLRFRQIAILRYGVLGAVFQFVFIATSSLLLFFDRRQPYVLTQALYFTLNIVFAVVSLGLGEDFYGVGFFAAALIAAAVTFIAAEGTFRRLNFLTFIGNNPSVRGVSTGTGRGVLGRLISRRA
jgi:polysaccharide biosynthesis protein PelG